MTEASARPSSGSSEGLALEPRLLLTEENVLMNQRKRLADVTRRCCLVTYENQA
ncbi:MAG TPA: hypothetical protein VJ810_28255 [Blastocatellia bacterium]|nr:hypothetical protein [Blastocatellia bacterium]